MGIGVHGSEVVNHHGGRQHPIESMHGLREGFQSPRKIYMSYVIHPVDPGVGAPRTHHPLRGPVEQPKCVGKYPLDGGLTGLNLPAGEITSVVGDR